MHSDGRIVHLTMMVAAFLAREHLERLLLGADRVVELFGQAPSARRSDSHMHARLRERAFISHRQRLNRISARRTISLSTIAMAASMAISPNSRVGSKVCVNMLVK